MTLPEQETFLKAFYRDALDVFSNRASDYAPDGVVFLNVLKTCVDWQMSPFQVLGVLLEKQCTALQRYCAVQILDSDPPFSRLRDAANYFACFAMYLDRRQQIHDGWFRFWTMKPCTCSFNALCHRCRTLGWLASNAPTK